MTDQAVTGVADPSRARRTAGPRPRGSCSRRPSAAGRGRASRPRGESSGSTWASPARSPGATTVAASPATTSTRSPTSAWSRPCRGFDPSHGSDFLSFAVPDHPRRDPALLPRLRLDDPAAALGPGAAVQDHRGGGRALPGAGPLAAPLRDRRAPRRRPRPGRRLAGRQRLLRPDVPRRPRRRGRERPRSTGSAASTPAFASAEARIALGPLLRGPHPARAPDPRDALLRRLHPGRDRRRGRRHPDAGLAAADAAARAAAAQLEAEPPERPVA